MNFKYLYKSLTDVRMKTYDVSLANEVDDPAYDWTRRAYCMVLHACILANFLSVVGSEFEISNRNIIIQ